MPRDMQQGSFSLADSDEISSLEIRRGVEMCGVCTPSRKGGGGLNSRTKFVWERGGLKPLENWTGGVLGVCCGYLMRINFGRRSWCP